MSNKFIKPEFDPKIDPATYFNQNKVDYLNGIILSKIPNIKEIKPNFFVIKDALGEVTIKYDGCSFISSANISVLVEGINYSPFQLFSLLEYKGNHTAAWLHVSHTLMGKKLPYVMVGIDYFKNIVTIDRFGIERKELKRWKKEVITDAHGKGILQFIDKFDSFVIEPNNKDYKPVIGNLYNLYTPFVHKANKGEWKWSEILLRHIFGDQYEIGLKYMQVLYLYPKQKLPVLVLASTERETGKSTFLDWLSILFGANMVVISPELFMDSFNFSYGISNIIGIEEATTDKAEVTEKIKALSAGNFVHINQKFIDSYKLPFFGKIIITTNDEKKFLKVDSDEIRFWARKVGSIVHRNTSILEDLIAEIPAFLEYLESMPAPDVSKTRQVFLADEIKTDTLVEVMENSKTWLYKSMIEIFSNYFFENEYLDFFEASISDIKSKFFDKNAQVNHAFIKSTLQNEFKINPSDKIVRYNSIIDNSSKPGKPYTITKEMLGIGDIEPRPFFMNDKNNNSDEKTVPF